VINLLLFLQSPQTYYGLPPQDSIHTLNVATSAPQANRAFFKPLKRAVERKGSWFADHVVNPTENSIMFEKNVEAVSGHSFVDSMEGLNLLFSTADEIAAFRTTDEIMTRGLRESGRSAEEILRMLRTSSRTRFPRCFKVAAISYPRFKGDAIQQETAKAKADIAEKGNDSKRYQSGPLATWEVNPRISGRSDFEDDYQDDPVMARRMYECKPELSADPWFKNKAQVFAAFEMLGDDQPPALTIEYSWGKAEGEKVEGWQVRFNFRSDLRPVQGARYVIHGDIGITKDAAGVAMSHVKEHREIEYVGKDEEGGDVILRETRPVVKVDFCTSFSANKTVEPPREVQIRWYTQLTQELIRRGFGIVRCTFDGFQSTQQMQDYTAMGITSERVSTDLNNDVWDTLRDTIYDGRLEAEYSPRVVTELLALNKLPNGKVDHPPYGSKDEADACGGSVFGAIIEGGSESAPILEAFPSGNPIMMGRSPFSMPESLRHVSMMS
jgi:hypothetical protein